MSLANTCVYPSKTGNKILDIMLSSSKLDFLTPPNHQILGIAASPMNDIDYFIFDQCSNYLWAFIMYLSVNWCPSIYKILGNSQGISGLVDKFANVDWCWDDFLAVFRVVQLDVVPWGFVGCLDPGLELFGSVHFGIVNPFLLFEILVVGADQILAEVESCGFLGGKLAGEDVEVFPNSEDGYTRESMLARNKLLFMYSSLANSSLAPLLRPVKR